MNNFGIRLKKILEQKNITQKELAEMAETTGATISRYISENRTPNAELITKIAAALNVTTDYLLGRVEHTAEAKMRVIYQDTQEVDAAILEDYLISNRDMGKDPFKIQLKAVLELRKISVEQLSFLSDLSIDLLNGLLSGQILPNNLQIKKIAKAVNLEASFFIVPPSKESYDIGYDLEQMLLKLKNNEPIFFHGIFIDDKNPFYIFLENFMRLAKLMIKK